MLKSEQNWHICCSEAAIVTTITSSGREFSSSMWKHAKNAFTEASFPTSSRASKLFILSDVYVTFSLYIWYGNLLNYRGVPSFDTTCRVISAFGKHTLVEPALNCCTNECSGIPRDRFG